MVPGGSIVIFDAFCESKPEQAALAEVFKQNQTLQAITQSVFPAAAVYWKSMQVRDTCVHHRNHIIIPKTDIHRDQLCDYLAQVMSSPPHGSARQLHLRLLRWRELDLAKLVLMNTSKLMEQEDLKMETCTVRELASVLCRLLTQSQLNLGEDARYSNDGLQQQLMARTEWIGGMIKASTMTMMITVM